MEVLSLLANPQDVFEPPDEEPLHVLLLRRAREQGWVVRKATRRQIVLKLPSGSPKDTFFIPVPSPPSFRRFLIAISA